MPRFGDMNSEKKCSIVRPNERQPISSILEVD